VAIPLTLLTLSGWAVWWKIEGQRSDKRWDNMLQEADVLDAKQASFKAFRERSLGPQGAYKVDSHT
jgi:hypothetical protein